MNVRRAAVWRRWRNTECFTETIKACWEDVSSPTAAWRCCEFCLRVFECDPSSLAFPYKNNELTQPDHTQQYHSVNESRVKGSVLLSWLDWKTLKSMTSAFWVYFYASLRRNVTQEFSCNRTYLVCAKDLAEIHNNQPNKNPEISHLNSNKCFTLNAW